MFLSVLKISISVILIMVVINELNFDLLVSTIKVVDLYTTVTACIVFSAIPVIQAYRWKYVLEVFHKFIGIKLAFQNTMIGIFFSNFLPSIGGDLIKASLTALKVERSWTICMISIVLEKVLGLLGLLILLVPSYFLWDQNSHWSSQSLKNSLPYFDNILIFFTFLTLMLIATFYYVNLKTKFLKRAFKSSNFQVISKANFCSKPFFYVVLAAILTQVFQTGTYFFVALSLGMNIDVYALIFFSQLVSLTIYLPVSFGGWGVREYLLISSASALNASPEDLFLLGVISGGIPFLVSAPGLYLWQAIKIEVPSDWRDRYQTFGKKKRLK